MNRYSTLCRRGQEGAKELTKEKRCHHNISEDAIHPGCVVLEGGGRVIVHGERVWRFGGCTGELARGSCAIEVAALNTDAVWY